MRIFSLIIAFALLTLCAYTQDANKVVAYGKVKVEWGNLDNVKIVLYEDGKEIDRLNPASNNGKFDFILELNHKYQFYFSKRNYVTKIVNFNTTVPENVLNSPDFEPFPDFDFYVTLFESYPEVDTMFFRNPVGKIQYSPKDVDFDWDKDYTLEIQRRMEQIEEDIRKKREQAELDKERKAKEAEEKAIAEAEVKKEAERLAKLEKDRLEQEKKDQEKAAKEAAKEAEEQAKQEKELIEKASKEKELADREAERKAQDEQKRFEKEQKEKEKAAQAAREKENQTAQVEETPVIDESLPEEKTKDPEPEPEPEIVQTSPESATIAEPPKITIPKAKEPKTDAQTVSRPVYTKPKIERTDVSKQEVAGKKVTRIEVQKGDITEVYLKVEYSWGGRFFFIQDEIDEFRNISESYFNIQTSNK